ncbi:mutator protein [Hordeum vulgare]|nr:mutator protein [Hordeum vulgare]
MHAVSWSPTLAAGWQSGKAVASIYLVLRPSGVQASMCAQRMVWLLNNVYDVEHRAYFMSEKKMELTPLKIRSHGASSVMQYDERYTPYIEMTRLLPFIQLLDDACRRTTKDGGVGGCMLLLSVWSWERLPVGRPKSSKWNTWDDHGNPVRLPTWAYKWDLVSEVASEVNLLYKRYTNEMDSLTPEQVEWQPYGAGPNFGDAHTFELNPLCVQEKHLWLMRCPLICNWAVEFHLPHRVMHQFGFFQPHPPEWVDTDTQLHRLDRRRQRKIKDCHKHHKSYVIKFEQSVQTASRIQRTQYRQHCPLAFNNYLRWFQESTRVEICPPAYEEDILEEPTEYDALAQGDYNKLIREGYQTSFALVLNFVHKEIKKQADESEDILEKTPGGKKGKSALRLFIKVADGMTLKAFQCSAYMLKPRKEFRRYSPDDYAKGKNPVAGGSRLSRMRSMDDEDDDDNDDESDDPEQFVVSRRKKLVSKRGRGVKM